MLKVVHKNQGILEFSQNLRIDIIEITRPFISLDGYIYFKSIKTEAIVYKRRKNKAATAIFSHEIKVKKWTINPLIMIDHRSTF